VRFALTEQLLDEVRRFELRSACRDCFYWRAAHGGCAHDWPDEGQRRWPLDAPNADGTRPTEVAFCKEFELR
jgi:radical SAM protein with 4Fe4S-binding SPASM domain